ncbi:MAG: hypothetical protein KGM43_16940 [Planctomycetota bacterium]|nr:hypothetical protein [Planctomycetota bacterium]
MNIEISWQQVLAGLPELPRAPTADFDGSFAATQPSRLRMTRLLDYFNEIDTGSGTWIEILHGNQRRQGKSRPPKSSLCVLVDPSARASKSAGCSTPAFL